MPLLPEVLPLLLFILIAAAVVGLLLTLAWWLGTKRTSPAKETPYESGMVPSGSARLHLTVPFYLIAIFFIVFDVETAFIFTWGVAWRELGLPGLLHITFFIVALLLGLAWLWRKGGLEWGPSRLRRRHEPN